MSQEQTNAGNIRLVVKLVVEKCLLVSLTDVMVTRVSTIYTCGLSRPWTTQTANECI